MMCIMYMYVIRDLLRSRDVLGIFFQLLPVPVGTCYAMDCRLFATKYR